MKKNIFKIVSVVLLATIILLTLAGCGSESSNYEATYDAMDSYDADSIVNESTAKSTNSSGENSKGDNVSTNRKIIEKLSYSVETKEFDKFIEDITKKISDVGGYIEESNISGNSYSYTGKKKADLTIRIPSSQKKDFTNYISVNSNIVSKLSSSEDVTLKYVDIESRISALTSEKESLEEILKQAKTVSDVLTVKEKLTDVIYEIESYKSQLKTYDSLIEFTTIKLNILDVDEMTNTEKIGFFGQIKETFVNSIHGVISVAKALAIIVIGGSPYIVLILLFVALSFFIIKKVNKKTTQKISKPLPSMYNSKQNQNNSQSDGK